MTAFNFILNPDYVLVFMDSLSLKTNKEPLKYASKIFPLPHLNGVLCGTGSLNTIIDWYVYIQLQIVGNLMEIPNKIAPSQLKKIHSKYDLNGTNEATIYHFGFCPLEGKIKGYALRSTNNFLLEELKYGIGIKPHDTDIIKYLSDSMVARPNLTDLFIDIMKMQKKNDEQKDHQERIGIGGSIHMYHLESNHQFLWECYNFDDFNEMYSKMLYGDGITQVQ